MYAELKRKCTKCHEEKRVAEFPIRTDCKSGVRRHCKSCQKRKEFVRSLKRHYNMTEAQYQQMWTSQNGKCACCGRHEGVFKNKLHVDHDHVTGKIRALLCTKCNPGIGYFDDSTNKLQMAINYLNKFKN